MDQLSIHRSGISILTNHTMSEAPRTIQDAGGRSFCCYYVREGECRNAMRCGFAHLSLNEVKALKKEYPGECEDGSGRPRVQCDNCWFDGTCYHKDLREHP